MFYLWARWIFFSITLPFASKFPANFLIHYMFLSVTDWDMSIKLCAFFSVFNFVYEYHFLSGMQFHMCGFPNSGGSLLVLCSIFVLSFITMWYSMKTWHLFMLHGWEAVPRAISFERLQLLPVRTMGFLPKEQSTAHF